MGKEWYWAGKSSKRSVSSSEGAETTQTSSGCMCAVFHFFDFHPFHFPTTLNQQQTPFKSTTCISQDHTTITKGAEAPRNSLESEDGTTRVSSFSKEDNFKIPIKNIQQIKTTSVGGNLNDCSSPGTKTPTLVARLMGLDLLPNGDSPSFSSTLSTPNTQSNNNVPNLHLLRTKQQNQTKPRNSIDSSDITTRSLPETPRISSSRRSDVDLHHRLSLQINKENYLGGEDLELPRFSFSKRKNDENNSKSPSHYARQIVKQVKESVSRRVGQDITNTTLKSKDQAREEFVGQFRVKKSPKSSLKALDESSLGKHSTSNQSSCSSRLRFIDTKHNKPNTTTTTTSSSSPHPPKDQNTNLKTPSPQAVVNTQPQLPRVLTKQELLGDQKILVPKCNNKVITTNEKFSSRFKRLPQTSNVIRNKQEETFIIRPTSPTRSANDIKTTKGKKIQPLSSNLLNNINNVPNLLPALKTHPSPPATKIPPKQVSNTSQESKCCTQLSRCSRQRYYKQEGTTTLATQEINTQDNLNGVSTSTGASEHHTPEFQYITQILNRTNPLHTTTVLSMNHWFSPKHPLDPSIFHNLEHHPNDKNRNFTTKNQLGHRWNRKLLFDLADEVLKEILRTKSSEKKLCFLHGFSYNWSIGELSEKVLKRVEEFPCAKCDVLEDIDDLIKAQDMEKLKVESEEEGEKLVEEIEGKIFDTLVHETVMVMKWGPCFLKNDGVVL